MLENDWKHSHLSRVDFSYKRWYRNSIRDNESIFLFVQSMHCHVSHLHASIAWPHYRGFAKNALIVLTPIFCHRILQVPQS